MPIRVLVRKKPDREHLLLYFIDSLTGREVSKSAGTGNLAEAQKEAGRWEDELRQHRGDADDGWKYFRDRFRDEHLAALSPRSRASYKTALNHYQRLMNPGTVSQITVSAVSVFQSKLLAENRPLTSVVNYLTHLRTALNWAEEVGILQKAPKIRMPRQQKRSFMRGRPITAAEYRKMLACCPAPEWRRLLELLWLSGLRLGEALRLSWSSPPITADLDAKPYPQIVFFAEGHKARRDETVPMTPDLAAWLSKTPRRARIGPVTPLPTSCQRSVSDQITAVGEAAGVVVNDKGKAGSAQDFRRSFGTRWAQKVMPMTLQKLMRHSDISTTLKFYIGLSSADAGRELWGGPVPKNVPKPAAKRQKAG